MNKETELEQMKKEYRNIQIPENGFTDLQQTIERAKEEKQRKRKVIVYKRIAACAAAVLMLVVVTPNVSVTVAMAMEKIPILGNIVKVVTFGRYDFEDERHDAAVEIPKVEVEVSGEEALNEGIWKESEDAINKEIEDYTDQLIAEFEKSVEEDEMKSLDVSYEVVTDNDQWFTLRIDVLEIQASGYMHSQYYHLNKMTGERAFLKDIFKEGSDYVTVISGNIKDQMREQMAADENKIYFIDSVDMPELDFDKIKEDQNFYFNEDGQIVIAFDEYEVAPGYMGKLEFTIPNDVVEEIRVF